MGTKTNFVGIDCSSGLASAQIRKSKENFFVGWRASTRGGGAASLVPFKVGSREVYNYSRVLHKIKKQKTSRLRIKGWGLDSPPGAERSI